MPNHSVPAAARGLPLATPRNVVEVVILQLIDLLDLLDADSEAEPSLGSVGSDQEYWAQGSPWALDAELDDSDHEPSLAAPECCGNQMAWARGLDDDLEDSLVDDDRPVPGPSYRRQCMAAAERRALEREIAVLAARIRRRARSVTRMQRGRDVKG